jgi:butyryl-CoA dehydrogenase
VQRARQWPALAAQADALARALQRIGAAAQAAWASGDPQEALANAVPYLQAFGHAVIAWLWLDVACAAQRRLDDGAQGEARSKRLGQLAACRYFFGYELPKIEAWLAVVESRDATCRDAREEWF